MARQYHAAGEVPVREAGYPQESRIARVIFCVEQESMVLLHAFMKKTQKTPQREIDLALKRKKGTRT